MTKVIAGKNCSGKTKEIIKRSLETGNPILALTPTKARSLKEKSLAYFGEDVKIISAEELKLYSGAVCIDDVDEVITPLLQQSLGNNELEISTAAVNIE